MRVNIRRLQEWNKIRGYFYIFVSALLTALLSVLIFNAVNWERNYFKLDIRVLVILPLVAILNFMSKAADCCLMGIRISHATTLTSKNMVYIRNRDSSIHAR